LPAPTARSSIENEVELVAAFGFAQMSTS